MGTVLIIITVSYQLMMRIHNVIVCKKSILSNPYVDGYIFCLNSRDETNWPGYQSVKLHRFVLKDQY